jgi:signal transduction histidine kinase
MIRRWLSDTLFKRLFVLMWVALVGSHLVAYAVVTKRFLPGPDAGPPISLSNLPTFPSLPPTPGLPDSPRADGPPGPPGGAPPGPVGAGHSRGHPGLPLNMLVLDYGVRLLIIGLAAWWGARWLSAPMRRLARASRSLGASLGRDAEPPRLDEHRGTVEVRNAAQVFNEMAGQLNDQFKARGLLVAAISHDLRTPLTRMRMRLETMGDDNAAAQRCIADVREMSELIDSVLAVFRDAGSTEPMQSTDVLALVQSLTDDLIEQGQPVSLVGVSAVARAQPAALGRVLANLLSNAVRYGERAHVVVDAHDGKVGIVIEDEGPGIPEGQLEAVFQPFYRVESSRSRHTGGTGLGLYIARDLIGRQGGTLTLTNRAAGGLRAEIVLSSA